MSEYRVNEVVERILSKRETYERIIANTFSCDWSALDLYWIASWNCFPNVPRLITCVKRTHRK